MATKSVMEKAVATQDPTAKKETAQIKVAAVDPDKNVKDEATSDEKLAMLLKRIEELEKGIGELKKKDAEEKAEKDDESKTLFGSLPKVCLTLFDSMKLSSTVVKESEKLNSCAITVFYDVPPSVVNNLDSWKEGSQTPGYLPSRVSINSKNILKLLEEITDTTMNDAPCIMIPPFKLFAIYWKKIEAKLQQLKDDFLKRHNHQWDAKPKDETPQPRPLNEEDAKGDADREKREKDRQDVQHLQCLVDFMVKYLYDITDLRERIKSKQIESISFDNLWHLFNPGDIILSRALSSKREQQAYQVFTVTKGRINMKEGRSERSKSKDERESNDLQLQCFSLDYDGTKIATREELLSIKPFVNKKKITDLDYYPKAFATDEEVENLRKRACRFIDNRYGHGRCEGITSRFEIEHIDNEEVFVDFKSGYEEVPTDWKQTRQFGMMSPPDCESDETYEPSCGLLDCKSCSNCIYLDEQVDIKRAEAARDKMPRSVSEDNINSLKSIPERLLLLPRHLLVYTLRTKKWRFVDVRDFEKIVLTPEKIREGWKNLVIEPKTKRLLKAVVSDHATTMVTDKKATLARSGTAIDIVRGKGRGRIVFLYGPPGVGKTSTAETIAAFTSPRRPLYPITCGDLGSDPKDIQDALEGHFKLAHRWNCVLLLDEADVYLAERHHTDLDRNGIVSVFLRTLEYYSGILFLTSNRVGSIDPAFKSRIHMALRYKKIDLNGTRAIWDNILNGIDKDNTDPRVKVKIEYERDDLLVWAEEHFKRMEDDGLPTWNGRQIRNAFQSAIALASHDRLEMIRKSKITEEKALKSKTLKKISLLEKHFDDVSKIVQEFEDYLINCGKGDDKAEKEGLLAPENGGARTQAYGRGANGTTRAREQKTTAQAKPKPPAARPRRQSRAAPPPPANTSRNPARRQATESKRVISTVNGRDEDDDEDDEVHGFDNGNGDGDEDAAEEDEDLDSDDIDMEENGIEFDGEDGNDPEGLDGDEVIEDGDYDVDEEVDDVEHY